jgi:cytoskeletal protein CcmA (bactofilin family)
MKLRGQGSSGDLNGFLDAGSHIKGDLLFEDTFRVDGKVTGKILSDGDLVVGVGGEVDGEVVVGRVFVSGTLRGRIKAAKRIEIAPGGRVYATLETPSLVIEDGAFFEGQSAMVRESAAVTELGPKPLQAGKPR